MKNAIANVKAVIESVAELFFKIFLLICGMACFYLIFSDAPKVHNPLSAFLLFFVGIGLCLLATAD